MKVMALLLTLTFTSFSYASELSAMMDAVTHLASSSKIGSSKVLKSISASDQLPEELVKTWMISKKASLYLKGKSGRIIYLEKNVENQFGLNPNELIKITSVHKIANPQSAAAKAIKVEKAVTAELADAGISVENKVGFDMRNSGVLVKEEMTYFHFEEVYFTKEALKEMDVGVLENVLDKLTKI